jgi:hypothetical protein
LADSARCRATSTRDKLARVWRGAAISEKRLTEPARLMIEIGRPSILSRFFRAPLTRTMPQKPLLLIPASPWPVMALVWR